ELHQSAIQKWKPSLNRVSHPHTVSLRRQKVLREENFDLEVLSSCQGTPIPELCPELLFKEITGMLCDLLLNFQAEEAAIATTIAPADCVRIIRSFDIQQVLTKEGSQEGGVVPRERSDVGIEALEQTRTPRRVGLPGPKTPDFRFFENIVACQELVGAFSGHNHFIAAVPNQFGQQEH